MINIENLTKTYNYKKSNAFTALKEVSLKIDDGEMVAIIIGCIDTFESGTYTIDETNVHKLSDKQLANIRNEKVGIVMQDFALVEEYTVLENVRIPLYFSHSKTPPSDFFVKNSRTTLSYSLFKPFFTFFFINLFNSSNSFSLSTVCSFVRVSTNPLFFTIERVFIDELLTNSITSFNE